MYSPDQWEILAEVNSVACITIVSLIFGRKIAAMEGPVRYVQSLLFILYTFSWAFNLVACMLTSTNNGNYLSCVLTNFNSVILYTGTKIVLFLYFIEKVLKKYSVHYFLNTEGRMFYRLISFLHQKNPVSGLHFT